MLCTQYKIIQNKITQLPKEVKSFLKVLNLITLFSAGACFILLGPFLIA
jgi:hypothetical protein